MNTCIFLHCTLVVLLERIFPRCEGLYSSSFSSVFIGSASGLNTEISYPVSTPWCSNCSKATVSNSSIQSPNQTRIQSGSTEYYMPSSVTRTAFVVIPTRQVITESATKPPQRLPPTAAQLTSFGIFLLTFGGVLIAFMIISLIWICCGREKSPEAPHPQVKLKPWSHSADHKTDDIATEASDLPNSFQNQGLHSSSPSSPSTPNNPVGRKTENFRESPLI